MKALTDEVVLHNPGSLIQGLNRVLDYHRLTARVANVDIDRSEAEEDIVMSAMWAIVGEDFECQNALLDRSELLTDLLKEDFGRPPFL